ncbi:hypothetical protein OH799_02705 [Nocardia sp. NBC_00881]|uniref:hypothetical protein n=1 Tax=Nocardia sp. NBC_00881 TaxID=2975995 RepID=UPI00386FA120|nr:hypothetical protein OH799_02705 [Nocardia sp. NBC_00881]
MTTPDSTLLLPYRIEAGPQPRAETGPTHRQFRLTVGDGEIESGEPVQCRGFTVSVAAHSDPRLAARAVSLSTAVSAVSGRAHGQQWWIVPDTTDPARVVFRIRPEEPALFDGSWSVSFQIEMNPGFDSDIVDITEHTAVASTFTDRGGHVRISTLTAGSLAGLKGQA